MFKTFLLLEHLCLLWRFSDHLGLSPSDLSDGMMEWCSTSQGWGAASQDPGSHRAPSVPPSWRRIMRDSQLSSAGKHTENLEKPAQSHYCNTCLDPLKSWRSSEGWKYNQHHTERCTPHFWCTHPHCSQKKQHFCFWILIRCISVILKIFYLFHTVNVFPCFSFIRKEFK